MQYGATLKTLAPSPKTVNSLDTLAQIGTGQENQLLNEDFLVISQAVTEQSTLLKRARAKYLTNAIVFQLGNVEESPLNKSYWNTFHCAKVITKVGNEVTSSYCKNRWCMVCNRIRTAQLINAYQPIISEWQDKHFLTLTIPNVKGKVLHLAIERMNRVMRQIQATIKKRHQRKKLSFPKIQGLKKLECTYNPVRDDYHPHFHIITDSYYGAVEIKEEWLKRMVAAKDVAQHISKADDKTAIELFKYFTKVLTKTGGKENEKKYKIEPYVLDTIFRSIRRVRTFEPFGFRKARVDDGNSNSDSVDSDDYTTEQVLDSISYQWEQEFADWVDFESGECLSGYVPSQKMKILTG